PIPARPNRQRALDSPAAGWPEQLPQATSPRGDALFFCGLDHAVNVIVDHLDIGFGVTHPAGHDRQLEQLRAGLPGDERWHFFRELRLADNDGNLLGFHPTNELFDVARRWIDARLQLNRAEHFHPEPLRE